MSWHSLAHGLRMGAPLAFAVLLFLAGVALTMIAATALLLTALLVA